MVIIYNRMPTWFHIQVSMELEFPDQIEIYKDTMAGSGWKKIQTEQSHNWAYTLRKP